MTRRNAVMIVDDARHNRRALREILNETYIVLEAESGKEALELLEERYVAVSLILLDLVMPDMDGMEVLRRLHADERFRSIPIILMVREVNDEIECKGIELGVCDFMRKPYDPTIVRFRVKNLIERSHLELSHALGHRADHDVLTAIHNKPRFFFDTRSMINMYPKEKFAFVRIDIEKFQLINAFFGMDEGDGLLKRLAAYLAELAKQYEKITYGRIEADIFAVCFSYRRKEEIINFTKEVRGFLESYPLEFDITPFFGIYLVTDRKMSMNKMYDCANLAAKRGKGNYIKNYSFYTEEMREELIKEQTIVNSMKSALNNERFVLYLQPKYELQRNSIAGAEVLVRWIGEDGRIISPGEFIPVFERNGFILTLDQYIWEKTCKLLAKWRSEGRKIQPLSVNISRVSLYNPKLVEIICGLVEKYDIPTELLQLELTESAYSSNPDAIRKMMEDLQKKGFTILMDDFGSGYSSLNVLKDIAVDILKIDMKFLSDSGKNGRSENILASVVRMAKWLNMPVVAEGAEQKEQVVFLRSIGCEYVQGYYFARPMPIEDYEKLAYESPEASAKAEQKGAGGVNGFWTVNTQMEMMFANMLQAAAIYEYRGGDIEVIRVNDAYYDLFGYCDINQVHREIEASIERGQRKDFERAFEETVRTKGTVECEYVRKLDDDRKIWVKLRLKYINNVGDRDIIFGCLEDISAQKRMDEELNKYRFALQSAVRRDKTMLVVDDMKLNRTCLGDIFRKEYRIFEAENGKEALDLIEQLKGQVDVVLLDLVMPVMDGKSFMEMRRHDAKLSNIPVVIITSEDSSQQQVDALEMGANDYIVKPFIPEIVYKRVENVFESSRRLGEVLQGYGT